jgi:hypothetical protein
MNSVQRKDTSDLQRLLLSSSQLNTDVTKPPKQRAKGIAKYERC